MASHKRRIRLVRPRLQLRLIGSFLGVALLALSLQYMVFLRVLADTALSLPHDGAALMADAPRRLGFVFTVSVVVLLPATFVVGLLVTHRIVGPIYRFESYLKQVIARKTVEPCRLRSGDELNELCELINGVTEPLRAGAPRSEALVKSSGESEPPSARAA
jgi:hypothetical protein